MRSCICINNMRIHSTAFVACAHLACLYLDDALHDFCLMHAVSETHAEHKKGNAME